VTSASSTSPTSPSPPSSTSATLAPPGGPAPAADAAPRRLVALIARARQAAILAVLVLLLLATELDNHRFLSNQGIKDLLLDAAILMLVAVGQAVVVITRNVDLSVGSVLGVSAFATGDLLAGGANTAWAVTAAVLLGIGFGLVNGLLVSFGQVPALVVTLGMLYVVRGIDSIWVGPREITSQQLPSGYADFGHNGLGPIPYLALIAVAATAAVGYYLARYRSGREFYAIGSNAQAARLAGIGLRKRIIAAYIFAGALAGLAGALYVARFAYVDATTGSGYELTVISAVVVGGVAMTGGVGTVYGAALGALLLTSINSVLPALNVSSVWEEAIDGALLLLAIAADRIVAGRVTTALRERSAHHG
jgi:rhamnose transport system permease protein